VIGVAFVLIFAMGISLYYIDKNHEKLVMEQVDLQAKALFRQIVLTRKWIADHGGVFVEKLPWKMPSPYLSEPEIIDIKGRKYVKESPAMVTKELSQYAKKEGLFWFHITSMKLINPENAPDNFERTALKRFETEQISESSEVEKIGSTYFYRYIAPLHVEEACLKCHSHQGYKLGDVRGAISVSVPMDSAFEMLRSGKRGLILASVTTIGLLMLVLYVMMKELVLRPVKELKVSMKKFSKGEQSETSLIRTGDELEDLSSSFAEMSESLTKYHTRLEKEVQRATKSLGEANTRLTELNEKKSDFIAKISHELRTPMTSIKGAMDYISAKVSKISRTDKDAGDLIDFLNVIKNNADRLIRMVNDTLDLERIESGVFDLHIEQVDLLALIKEVIISFQSIASERNITFKIVASPKVTVNADEDRIRQVLINLVSNAINYSPENAEIQFTVIESDKEIKIVLKDEGPGIPVEVQEKIFDKFYTIGKRYGTGLGLAICRGIIEAHKGEIKVLKEVAKGSAIYFTIPKNGKGDFGISVI
jgi:signal transduction histidine kinase